MTNAITLTLSCCMCPASHQTTVAVPDAWDFRHLSVDVENAFCPIHAPITTWTRAQCPGCVGSWGDCELWNSFAYCDAGLLLSLQDLDTIASGRCPRRTNGSFAFSQEEGLQDLNLSEPAPAGGDDLVRAILAYRAHYCKA